VGTPRKLIKPNEESDLGIQTRLLQLLKWDVTTSYPLTLKLYDAYTNQRITNEEFVQCLQNIESFVVRRMVCAVPTNQLKRIFLQAAKEFTSTNALAWLRNNLVPAQLGAGGPAMPEVASPFRYPGNWCRFNWRVAKLDLPRCRQFNGSVHGGEP
jgi:hypothetical protein